MQKREILDVFSFTREGKQKVGFIVEGMESPVFLSFNNVGTCTNVDIKEFEILIGSKIKPKLYRKGEAMYNGEICQEDNSVIKDFWIECSGSIEEMRKQNFDKIKHFKKIEKTFSFHRDGKDVIGFDVGDERAVFVPAAKVTGPFSINLAEIHIFRGAFVAPEYYKKGENIYEGLDREPDFCRKDGVLVKKLNLRFYGSIEELREKSLEKPQSSPSATCNDHSYSYSSDYDTRNWLADAAGSNDPEMMSVAYWNMD